MGLIRAALNSLSGTLQDQWEDYIKCDSLDDDTLMVKMTTKSGQISAKSRIQVNPGQCAIIIDSGKILDATAEEGTFTFDASSSPSLFAGQFGETFKEMIQRFTYNGTPAKEQAIYYINITEIKSDKLLFGTPNPIPFQDWSHPIPNEMTGSMTPLRVEVKCFGRYTFTISDPVAFLRNVGTRDIYRTEDIVGIIKSEVNDSFKSVVNVLGNSEYKTPVLEMPSATDQIKEIMEQKGFYSKERGIKFVSFNVESVTLDEESERKIDDYELSSNSFMQRGKLTGAYANAVQDAANNEGGAMNGILGVGMMNMASGGMIGGVAQSAFNNQPTQNATQSYDPYAKGQATAAPAEPAQPAPAASGKICSNCGLEVAGNFCTNCGTKYEAPAKKVCPNCGKEVAGKFCGDCGTAVE